jgi:hypothetical protein
MQQLALFILFKKKLLTAASRWKLTNIGHTNIYGGSDTTNTSGHVSDVGY